MRAAFNRSVGAVLRAELLNSDVFMDDCYVLSLAIVLAV